MKERLAWLQNSAFQRGYFYFYKARKDLLYFIVLLTYPKIPQSQPISTFGVDGIGNITAVLNHYGSFLGCPLCQRRNQNSRVSRKIFVLHGKESALKDFENTLLGPLIRVIWRRMTQKGHFTSPGFLVAMVMLP